MSPRVCTSRPSRHTPFALSTTLRGAVSAAHADVPADDGALVAQVFPEVGERVGVGVELRKSVPDVLLPRVAEDVELRLIRVEDDPGRPMGAFSKKSP
jgi:hypothetical protein